MSPSNITFPVPPIGLTCFDIAIAPHTGPDGPEPGASELDNHQGISFDNWLDLFLDYAIGLAMTHRRDEAYQVCEAARDSTAFQAPEHGFIIHVAWTGKTFSLRCRIFNYSRCQYVPST